MPTIEAHSSDHLVDSVDNVLDNDRRFIGLQGLEELSQCGLALLFSRHFVDGLLRGYGVAGQFQELAEEFQARLLDIGIPLAKSVESLA